MDDTPPPLAANVRTIRVRRIKAGSLFKLVFLSTAVVIVPFSVICGLCAFFGAHTVELMNRPVTGAMGLVTALIVAPVATLFFTVFAWAGAYIAIRLLGCFAPVTIQYVPAEDGN